MGPKRSKIDGHKISESETNKDLIISSVKCTDKHITSFVRCVKLSSATSVLQIIIKYMHTITDIYKCTNLSGKITQVKTKEEKKRRE